LYKELPLLAVELLPVPEAEQLLHLFTCHFSTELRQKKIVLTFQLKAQEGDLDP
jgi:hypothetical protein